jgi:hypothetical protein
MRTPSDRHASRNPQGKFRRMQQRGRALLPQATEIGRRIDLRAHCVGVQQFDILAQFRDLAQLIELPRLRRHADVAGALEVAVDLVRVQRSFDLGQVFRAESFQHIVSALDAAALGLDDAVREADHQSWQRIYAHLTGHPNIARNAAYLIETMPDSSFPTAIDLFLNALAVSAR